MFWDNWFRGKKKEVMLLRPNDMHFTDIKILDERDRALETPKVKGVTRFFLKRHRGWTNDKNGTSRYFGLEGYDFTLRLQTTEQTVLNLLEAVKIVLSDIDLGKFTPQAKDALESAKLCITTEPVTNEGIDLPNEGNENAFSEVDKALTKAKAEAMAKAQKGNKFEWTTLLTGLAIGIVIGLALVNWKIFKMG